MEQPPPAEDERTADAPEETPVPEPAQVVDPQPATRTPAPGTEPEAAVAEAHPATQSAEPAAAEDATPDEEATGTGDASAQTQAGTSEGEAAQAPEASGANAPAEAEAEAEAEAKPEAKAEGAKTPRKARKKKPKPRKRPPPRAPVKPLPPELKEQAREAAVAHAAQATSMKPETVRRVVEQLEAGRSVVFLARFRRPLVAGMDERHLRAFHESWRDALEREEHRVRIRALLEKRGALDEAAAEHLAQARDTHAMDDLAAPWLPVTASRATMARGQGLQGLADAIRAASDETPLSELAKPYVPAAPEDAAHAQKPGNADEPSEGAPADATGLDAALSGARDILAEELSLDATLRARLRELYRKEAVVTVAARSEKRAEGKKEGSARHALVGLSMRASKVPPVKVLAIRRAEKLRQVVTTIEPDEAKALEIVHAAAVPPEHPHAGFLRAAAEDGYRRILKPMLQNEMRHAIKQRADAYALEQYERNLRNLLLAPYAGARRVLGLRPDVMKGHRWCAVDEQGRPAGSGTLPHEPTAGREACLTELTDVLKTYEVDAVAVGTTGGRADALSLAKEAAGDVERPIDVAEVPDGGTRTLEAMGPLEFEEHLVVPAECRGALSLARRFQDPLAELVTLDPKALALGPHLHDVHQGRLRRMLDEVVSSCVAHVGVDPNSAPVELLARVPGFDRASAEALVAWRTNVGPLHSKAELAAVEGVGPEVAEQAVGFLRLADAEDARDRSQLHPEQYGALDKMASQAEVDVETLFRDADARRRVHLDGLADAETSAATLRYALFQATAGQRDPRQRFTHPIAPPEGMDLASLAEIVGRRGRIELQGRVLRAAPFGVFVDVGLGLEALIPMPHLGDRPGIEPSTVAPVGAVVTARVLEVDQQKKRLTLSMRSDRGPRAGRGPRGPRPARGPRPDRRPRPPSAAGAPAGAPVHGGRPESDRRDRSRDGGDRRREPGDRGRGRGRGGRPAGDRGRGGGRPQGGRGGRRGGSERFGGQGGGRGRRDDRGGNRPPRRITLSADEPKAEETPVDEASLSPEELLKLKLEQMRRKLERPDAD